jgi:hypothetical protein
MIVTVITQNIRGTPQPARMILDNHIKEGKENLNFSTFGDYSQQAGNKLERIVKQIG